MSSSCRSSVRSSASVVAAPTAFTIEEYKRKQKVLAASKKPHRRRTNTSVTSSKVILSATDISPARSSSSRTAATASSLAARGRKTAEPTYSKAQKQYLDFCVEKLVDPDMKLLSAIRSASLAAYKTKRLLRLEIVGVRIASDLATMLTKAIASCAHLEFVSFAQTRLGDAGIEAIAMALGKCTNLQQLSLAGCQLTDKARDHVSKIITLHGVLKDETVWSSSLRGETVSVFAARPSLLLDLSQNALGDETAESICNALFHDKWLLGLNLSQNRISRAGILQIADTLAQSNRTLAVIQVGSMKEPGMSDSCIAMILHMSSSGLCVADIYTVDQVDLRRLEALMLKQKAFLQNLVFETREKRLLLCSLLLEWDVNRELVLEICQSTELRDTKSRSSSASVSGSSASSASSSSFRAWTDENEAASHQPGIAKAGAHDRRSGRVSNQEEEEGEEGKRDVESDNQSEEGNQQLRDQLKTTISSGGMSHIEERIIARLEDTISTLAQQVGELTLDNSSVATPTAATPHDKAAEKENVLDSEQEQ